MLDASKAYDFTIRFGAETDTLDLEGAVVAQSTVRPALAEVEAMLLRFTGTIDQVPPAYSALMVDGERAYDRARAGEDVDLPARKVEVFDLKILPGHGEEMESATLTAHVSKGTYIRSLARDIALALGTRGHITYLRRTRAGPFGLAGAISLDKLNEIGKGAPLKNVILPLEAGLDDIPALDLSPAEAGAVRQGRVLTGLAYDDGLYWARLGSIPVALVELSSGDVRVIRGFNLSDVAE
jgi:tRNA pseudouridine55 synthase